MESIVFVKAIISRVSHLSCRYKNFKRLWHIPIEIIRHILETSFHYNGSLYIEIILRNIHAWKLFRSATMLIWDFNTTWINNIVEFGYIEMHNPYYVYLQMREKVLMITVFKKEAPLVTLQIKIFSFCHKISLNEDVKNRRPFR